MKNNPITSSTPSTASSPLHRAARAAMAASLAGALSLGMVPALPQAAFAEEAAGTAVEEQAPADEQDPTQGEQAQTVKITAHVNQNLYFTKGGSWSITCDTDYVKLSKESDALVFSMRKAGSTKVLFAEKDSGEELVWDLTIEKSNFKPVPMKKLQCYKEYRKYMTEAQFKKAYNKALKLVTPAGDLSKKDQLQYVTTALRNYFMDNMSYDSSKPHYNDPYGYLCLKRASCAGATRTTGLCLNILGIKFEHVNPNKWTHQWARVKVGKSYWIADPYTGYCGKEPAKRQHPYSFMF